MGNQPVAVWQWWINPLPCFNRTSSSSHYWGVKHPFQSKHCECRSTGKSSWITPSPLDQRDPSPCLSPRQTGCVCVVSHYLLRSSGAMCSGACGFNLASIWWYFIQSVWVSSLTCKQISHYLPETRFQCWWSQAKWWLQIRLNDRLTTTTATAVLTID